MARDTINFNKDDIMAAARNAALQAMPINQAHGINTTLQNEIYLIADAIEEMIRRTIDQKELGSGESVGIYRIDVNLAQHFGEGIGDKEKNVFQIDVDISIPLEVMNVYFPPNHYTAAKRMAKRIFSS